jgi:hypothetical protein
MTRKRTLTAPAKAKTAKPKAAPKHFYQAHFPSRDDEPLLPSDDESVVDDGEIKEDEEDE